MLTRRAACGHHTDGRGTANGNKRPADRHRGSAPGGDAGASSGGPDDPGDSRHTTA
jgi:hypothetical protein